MRWRSFDEIEVLGISSGLVPMYLTEISPVNLRGAIGSVNQLLVTIAILFSQIIGLPQVLGTRQLWPLIFGKEKFGAALSSRIKSSRVEIPSSAEDCPL